MLAMTSSRESRPSERFSSSVARLNDDVPNHWVPWGLPNSAQERVTSSYSSRNHRYRAMTWAPCGSSSGIVPAMSSVVS